MQLDSTVTKAKKTLERTADSTGSGTTNLKESLQSLRDQTVAFDQNPLDYARANPLRATALGFFVGLIFGAALSKRSVAR